MRKWKSSNEEALNRDSKVSQEIHCQEEYAKVLGMEWNMVSDCFHPMVPMFKVDEINVDEASPCFKYSSLI